MEMSLQDAARLRAVRAAVENELRLFDETLPRVSSPALKRTLAIARRDVANIEPDILRHVAESPDPGTLLAGAELCLARALGVRQLAQDSSRS
jgi:hypothetical protein